MLQEKVTHTTFTSHTNTSRTLDSVDRHMQALLCSGLRRRATEDIEGRDGTTGLHRSRELWQSLLLLGIVLTSKQLPCKRTNPGALRLTVEEDKSGFIVISAIGALMLKQLADISLCSSISRQFPMLLGRGLAVLWLVGWHSEERWELKLLWKVPILGQVLLEEVLQDMIQNPSVLGSISAGEGACGEELSVLLVLKEARLSADLKRSNLWLESADSSRILSKEQLLRVNLLGGRPIGCALEPWNWVLILVVNTSFMGDSVSSKDSFLIKLSKRHSVDLKALAAFRWGALAGWGQLGSSRLLRFPRCILGAVA